MTKKKPAAPAPAKKSAAPARSGAVSAVATPARPNAAQAQLKAFDQAMQFFSKRQFARAAGHFREVTKGPAVHIADKGRSYLQICERQTAKPALDFRTAEEHFNFSVERLNAGDTAQARAHLAKALGLEPKGDHILYTMALCCGLEGDGDGACENLKRAIELEPRNRILARQDPEFSALAAQLPGLRALLGWESNSNG